MKEGNYVEKKITGRRIIRGVYTRDCSWPLSWHDHHSPKSYCLMSVVLALFRSCKYPQISSVAGHQAVAKAHFKIKVFPKYEAVERVMSVHTIGCLKLLIQLQ